MNKFFITLLTGVLLIACSEQSSTETGQNVIPEVPSAELRELSDKEYPDNPDVLVRHSKYTSSVMDRIAFEGNPEENQFEIVIYPTRSEDDTVVMNNIALMEFMPTIPEQAKGDDYMSLIAVMNQEWNRNQVKWDGESLHNILPQKEFRVNGEVITRIDLARNCLRSYLWEVFFYAEEEGKNKVFYHGWFDFPAELYHELFEARNGASFNQYSEYLESWKTPPSKWLNLSLLRKVEAMKKNVPFVNHDEEMYPLTGERKKKEIEIIYPEAYTKMSDFHTDSARFATFSDPGYYNRQDPRKTQLGRFFKLKNIEYSITSFEQDLFDEFKLIFERENGEVTQFVFGGIQLKDLPHLSVDEANSGNQYSMGIGNHPFYEDVLSHEALSSQTNHYFGVLLDEEGNWLDSHMIGIDGPLLHLDAANPNILHIWMLSFERHALVGHYEVYLDKK